MEENATSPQDDGQREARCYLMGYLGALTGALIDESPFSPATPDAKNWSTGWIDGTAYKMAYPERVEFEAASLAELLEQTSRSGTP